MLTYRMDLTNFSQGARSGVRIVTVAGLKVDFNEPTPDAGTLGLWHLHNGACLGEGTGLEDASGGGHTMVNHGADLREDGYELTRVDADYLEAAVGSQPSRSSITLEAWVCGWNVPPDTSATLLQYNVGSMFTGWIYLLARRASSPGGSYIVAYHNVGGSAWEAWWTGAAADQVLAGAAPWHVALVLDSPASFRLFVNGILRASNTSNPQPLGAGTYTVYVGTTYAPAAPGSTFDEVQISGTARYAGTFSPQRLLASGTFSSLTFDSARLGARWADLVPLQTLPAGTAVGWEVRAADTTGPQGEPLAAWQPYGGDPSALPYGRHFQWRAALAASAGRLASPTVQSVDAKAGETGYDIYHAVGDGPETLDYVEPWARVGPQIAQLLTVPLDAAAVHWFGIRPVDAREVASPTSQGEAHLELDEQGGRMPERPAGALAICGRPLPAARARLTWGYRVGRSGAAAQVFRIFGDGGSGEIDYDSPLGEVPYSPPQAAYAWTSEALAAGIQHQLAVRAIAANGTWDAQPAIALVTPDSTPPVEVDSLEAEVIL